MWENRKERVAFISVLVAVLLVTFKLWIGIKTNSLGILSEALHSGLDLAAALMTMFAVISAAKPPDKDHQFGHGKIESVSALFETMLLLVTCIWIVYEALKRLIEGGGDVEASYLGFGIMGISIVLNSWRSWALYKAAKEFRSQALEADALHFLSDILSSGVVIVGLVFVRLGFPVGDPIAAIGVALFTMFAIIQLGKRTVEALLDKAPKGKRDEIHKRVGRIPGVVCERVRIRQSGPYWFADVVIGVDRNMRVAHSGSLMERVENEVRAVLKDADIVVHVKPIKATDENLRSQLMLIAAVMKGITGVHHIEVHRIGKKTVVDLHVEVASNTSVKRAHALVTRFEKKALSELELDEMNTHIETYECAESVGEDVTAKYPEIVEKVKGCAGDFIKEHPEFLNCHDIKVRRASGKFSVNVHCDMAEDTTLEKAHLISTLLERRFRTKLNVLDHAVIHVEPCDKACSKRKKK